MKKYILFGAGKYGKDGAKHYGIENVAYFVDNNESKVGTKILGISVINVSQLKDMKHLNEYELVICTKYAHIIKEQLLAEGINNFTVYSDLDCNRYYPENVLIFNPYAESHSVLSETTWNDENKDNPIINDIRKEVDRLSMDTPIFSHVEIETINRCNGVCEFCPVNAKNDIREKKIMPRDLFEKIIKELEAISYSGKIALFSNNEPFLDADIIDKHKYARMKLPNARFHLFTNGTLLTLDKFKEIIKYLDELIIDNYDENLKLIDNNSAIVAYCREHNELKQKVTIVLRNPKEILTSRGGDAPNRKNMVSYPKATCVLPFKQLIIRPDGKVSLCCNDPLGKNTMGDLTKESIMEIWYGARYAHVRKCLHDGRENWAHCIKCDVFNLG